MSVQGLEMRAARECTDEWSPGPKEIIVGKDILELLSSSMYIDPMSIYREYIQNSVDAIDESQRQGLLAPGEAGRVQVDLDLPTRTIRLRDNGTGIAGTAFAGRLTAFGGSPKRGTDARGFRGVGRLSGLGYCQELVFRSRVPGEASVSEMRWDCHRLKGALRSPAFRGDLVQLVRDVVSTRHVDGESWPKRFFEVELRGVIRHRNDRLLNPTAVTEYLSQVAPVPFSPEFSFGPDIARALTPHVAMGNVEIRISGAETPVTRPHRDLLEIDEGMFDAFTDVEIIEIPGVDGGMAAIAWVLQHGYTGAIPSRSLVKGLRLRAGNVQVGDHALLEELFPEPRFNAWSVGEVHVIDRRIVPNGRRDHFEQSVHYYNLLNQLAPLARDIARRCRTSSIRRRWIREFELQEAVARDRLAVIAQGSLGAAERSQVVRGAEHALATMEKIAGMEAFALKPDDPLHITVREVRAELQRLTNAAESTPPLAHLPPERRAMYEHFFALIYECSTNRVAAKALVDRILAKIREISLAEPESIERAAK